MTPSRSPWDDHDWLASEPRPSLPWAIQRQRAKVRNIWILAIAAAILLGGALAYAPAIGKSIVALMAHEN